MGKRKIIDKLRESSKVEEKLRLTSELCEVAEGDLGGETRKVIKFLLNFELQKSVIFVSFVTVKFLLNECQLKGGECNVPLSR